MNYFICDIVGTYEGNDFNRDEEIKKFVSNLNKLMELENMEELIFCFESSDDMKFVQKRITEFSKYIDGTKIKLGLQFSGDQYLDNGEIIDIVTSGKMEQTVFL